MQVVVVGGSLAGLMSAIPLIRMGHRVTILERSPTPLLHEQGAGIVAGGETLQFWSRFQVPGRQRDISVRSRERCYLDKEGQVIDREAWEQNMTSWDLLYYLGRAVFDGVESDYLPKEAEGGVRKEMNGGAPGKGVYAYGRNVKAIREAGDRVEIDFEHVGDGAEEKSGTLTADFLIAADGPSSTLRHMLIPSASERVYVGYVAFRGTVPENSLSSSAADVFVERFTFYHGPGCQILAYTIPGPAGSLEKGHRLVNWVWYWNYPQDSPELAELMTDIDGKRHRFTLPSGGKMQPHVWERQKEIATAVLPPQFAELVHKTQNPFVQAITDLRPPPPETKVGRLLNGKAVIVGDALSGFRPHTAASTSQAALHALLLEKVWKGELSWDEYEKAALLNAQFWQDRGVMLGTRSQFGTHPMAGGAPQNPVSREELNARKVVLEGAPDRR